MDTNEVRIIETGPIGKVRYCLIGLPDVGLVGIIAVNFIIRKLEMEEVGYLESDTFPPVVVIHGSQPKAISRLYRKEDLIALTSEVPFDPKVLPPLARSIVDWVKRRGGTILSASGIAVPNRLEIDVPKVYGVGTSDGLRGLLTKSGIQLLEEGFLVGPNAMILKESMREGVPNAVLLAQSHLRYPDPGAAASLVEGLNRMLSLEIDVQELLEQAEEIRVRTRELMQGTQRAMQRMEKVREQELPAMYV